MCEQTNTGASDLRKRYWQEHGGPPEGPGPHPDMGGPAYIPWLEALVAKLEAENEPLWMYYKASNESDYDSFQEAEKRIKALGGE